MKNILMIKGAKKIVEVCARVKPGEQAVIVTEPSMISIAEALAIAIYSIGAEPIISIIVPKELDGLEPPSSVAAAMKNSDVFFNVVNKSITHTNATINAAANGSRGIMMTQWNESMLINGGIEADFDNIAPICDKVANSLAGGNTITVTTPLGTNLTLSAKGRRGNALTCIVSKGMFTTVPTIEANVSPLEGSTEGILVADASIPYINIGMLNEPVVANINKGFITEITGGKQAKILSDNLSSLKDKMVYNIAELGIGLNPSCSFVGSMLEDEGVYGSVHIGIGTNISLGGNVKVPCHYDLIMTNATVIVDGKIILKNGDIVL